MQAEPRGSFRSFLQSAIGRVVLVLLAIAVVFATYSYVATILAIPVFLLAGLLLPIAVGLKRPRYLALAGLVVLLVVAPLSTIVFSQEVLIPPGSASTAGTGPYETGGSVLQNATVNPFSGPASTLFTWSVTIYPKFLEASLAGTSWSNDSLKLFVSTCPGATALNLSYCGSSYSLITDVHNFSRGNPPTNGSVVTFQQRVPSQGVWSWQMELILQNTSSPSNPYKIELVGDAQYDGLEGPVVGGFSVVYGALIGTVYEAEFLFLGIPFYFVLLLYMWFKSREARTKEALRRAKEEKAAAGGPATGTTPPVSPTSGAPGATATTAPSTAGSELACPNCGAVVYPKETKCWKCGVSLGAPPSGAPLPSADSPPRA